MWFNTLTFTHTHMLLPKLLGSSVLGFMQIRAGSIPGLFGKWQNHQKKSHHHPSRAPEISNTRCLHRFLLLTPEFINPSVQCHSSAHLEMWVVCGLLPLEGPGSLRGRNSALEQFSDNKTSLAVHKLTWKHGWLDDEYWGLWVTDRRFGSVGWNL